MSDGRVKVTGKPRKYFSLTEGLLATAALMVTVGQAEVDLAGGIYMSRRYSSGTGQNSGLRNTKTVKR